MKSHSFRDVIAWQKAHSLVLNVYELTKQFPKEELFGLTSQMRRSAISVAANISEGYRKKSKPDKARFYNIAQGSLDETLYYFNTCPRFGLCQYDRFTEQSRRSSKIATWVYQGLRSKSIID
jgi:four helix bundle protein